MGKEFKNEDFRDSISTVDESGKRVWIYPKKPFGRYFNWRKILSYVLLVFFFGAPFIHINGQPLLMLNIFERKFVIFSFPFWPQDFYMFVLAMITLIIFIVLFTVIYGRIFCGWICPQTIFMEMFFRRIEYWIEGDANQQRKLNKQEWNREKILKKGSKHLIFLVSAFAIGNTFMAYLVGREKWFDIVTHSPAEHLAGFFGVIVFSMAFYGVFAFLREQVCTTICPYGRLQSVLLDRDSIVIAYDWERGEPRGKIKKNDPKQEELGDCIDCNLCVSVCPTGIDIRNGTQLECINCTACIDACDQVMEKVDRPKGLIRYASYNNIAEKKPFRWTPRMLGYTGVLVVLLMILTGAMLTRSSVETTLLKAPGSLFQKVDDQISNIYTFQLVNKTSEEFDIELRLEEIEGSITVAGEETKVKGEEIYDGAVVIKIPKTELKTGKNQIRVGVYGNGKQIDVVKTQFLAP